jgi:HK97 family phage portal protein
VAPPAIMAAIAEVIAQRAGDTFDPYQLPVVVAARGLLADTIGQLPLITMRNRRPLDPQPGLTVRPNRGEYRWLTFHRATNQLTRYGYCWFLVTDRDAAGRVAAVRCLDAADATADFDPVTGELDTIWHNGLEYIPGLEALWCPLNVEARASLGTPPLTQAAGAVEFLQALWAMAGSFWETGYPSLVVEVVHRLAPGQAQEIKSQFVDSMGGRHTPAVVDQDGKISAIGASPLESQLVESIAWANAELARVFRMPPSLVNVAAGDSLTYSTTEGEFRRWLSTGLGAYLSRFEAVFNDLTPAGQSTRFETAELVRSDFAARYAAYATALAGAPWLGVDEVRDLEGLDPMPAGADPAPTTPLVEGVPA